MPGDIDARRRKQKRSAVWSVVLFACLQAACAVGFWALRKLPDMPRWGAVFCLFLAAACLMLVVPAVILLKQRFLEIEGGELDAAAEY